MTLQERFEAWRKSRGMTQEEVAAEVGCDRGYFALIFKGRKAADGSRKHPILGLELAHRIEELSAEWAEGPIRTEEWLTPAKDTAEHLDPATSERSPEEIDAEAGLDESRNGEAA